MHRVVHRLVSLAALAAVVLTATPPPGHAGEGSLVNINTASIAELAELPGVGDVKAEAIAAHRAGTPFESVEDLKKVKGIGARTFERLRASITVGSSPGGP